MMWSKRAYSVLVLSAVLLGARQAAYAQGTGEAVGEADEVEVSYEMFVLDNGLTLIVHEDHKAPIGLRPPLRASDV